MLRFILKRLAIAIPTILLIIVLSFMLMHAAPGGPFSNERNLPPEVLANIEQKYGLDRPLPEQIFVYVSGIITAFDFGPSFIYKNQSVNDLIGSGFPVTLVYGFWAFIFASISGIALGVIAALKHNSWIDYAATGTALLGSVLPNFVMAPLLVLLFTVYLNWLPGGGWEGGKIEFIIMPIIALATSYLAGITRIMRSSMLEVLGSDFIRTARAKGLPAHHIILRHALKPALLPVLTSLGLSFVGMITGSVVIDQFFSTGGIGQHFVNAALNRDYSVIMGVTILVGSLTIVFNLLVEVLYAWIDPRIRY